MKKVWNGLISLNYLIAYIPKFKLKIWFSDIFEFLSFMLWSNLKQNPSNIILSYKN